jgi:hypothetical protein
LHAVRIQTGKLGGSHARSAVQSSTSGNSRNHPRFQSSTHVPVSLHQHNRKPKVETRAGQSSRPGMQGAPALNRVRWETSGTRPYAGTCTAHHRCRLTDCSAVGSRTTPQDHGPGGKPPPTLQLKSWPLSKPDRIIPKGSQFLAREPKSTHPTPPSHHPLQSLCAPFYSQNPPQCTVARHRARTKTGPAAGFWLAVGGGSCRWRHLAPPQEHPDPVTLDGADIICQHCNAKSC